MRLGSTALATERVERRLAAILAADVAGYSRLMGADEEGTLARLKALRREVADPKIKEHRGRIVKTTGDGLLLEFASVVDAVRCAVEVQREITERNADVPRDRRIELRMGINVGDIIKDGRDIHGDGVNVAARLEALAEPGGICVSRVVRDEVRDKPLQEIIVKVWSYCEGSGIRGRTVTLKVKFANFQQITRSRTGQMQIRTRSELEQLSNALLEPLFPVARGVRLLGVSLSSLAEESEGQPEFTL